VDFEWAQERPGARFDPIPPRLALTERAERIQKDVNWAIEAGWQAEFEVGVGSILSEGAPLWKIARPRAGNPAERCLTDARSRPIKSSRGR
jgi:hypothetical protein